jgi:hypothetical protein
VIARTLWAGALLLCVGAGLSACATAGGEPPPILSKQSPVALRAMQIRAFDTPSKRRMTQAVIAALQDLGYTVEHIDYASGTISAAKLDALRLTVVIYPHGATQMSVRANAIVKLAAASTQVFLAALQTEDDATAPAPPLPPALPSAGKPPLKS